MDKKTETEKLIKESRKDLIKIQKAIEIDPNNAILYQVWGS